MLENEVEFLPLQAVRLRSNGKREYDPVAKRRLVQLCLSPGASVSGMALKAGVNANLLRKWIEQYRHAGDAAGATLPAFVPVMTIDNVVVPGPAAPESPPVVRCKIANPASRPAVPARLTAQLPNGVTVELTCGGQDIGLVKAMIEALGAG